MNQERALSSPLKFVILSCQSSINEDAINTLRNSVIAADNLEEVCMLAYEHGVYPLFYQALMKHASDLLDQEMQEAMTYLHRSITLTSKSMTDALICIVELLENHHIGVLSFKGPVLAQMLYGDVSRRQFRDLDLLIKKEDIYRVDALLKTKGYARFLSFTPVQEKIWMKSMHDLSFIHPEKDICVEAHWSLLDDDYPLAIDLNAFWQQPQIVNINNRKIKTFPTEELLLYLCIHGSKHLWDKMVWLKDIDVLIRSEIIDWNILIEKVENSGLKTMFYLGLSLTSLLFNTPLLQSITQRISEIKNLDDLTDYVLKNWHSSQNIFQTHAAKLKFFPGIPEQGLYLYNVIIKPSYWEFSYIDLPKNFYWAYYLVRPYRLTKKYFRLLICALKKRDTR